MPRRHPLHGRHPNATRRDVHYWRNRRDRLSSAFGGDIAAGHRFATASSTNYDWTMWECNDAIDTFSDLPGITYAFEVRTTSNATMRFFNIGSSSGSSGEDCRLTLRANESFHIECRDSTGGGSPGGWLIDRHYTNTTDIRDGNWHMVVLSFDVATATSYLYVSDTNGDFIQQAITSDRASTPQSGNGAIDLNTRLHYGCNGTGSGDKSPATEIEFRGFFVWDIAVDLASKNTRDKFYKDGARVGFGVDYDRPTGQKPVFTANATPTALNFGTGFGGTWILSGMDQEGKRGVDYPWDENKIAFFPQTKIDGAIETEWTEVTPSGTATDHDHTSASTSVATADVSGTWPADDVFPHLFGQSMHIGTSDNSTEEGMVVDSTSGWFNANLPDIPLHFHFWANNTSTGTGWKLRFRIWHDFSGASTAYTDFRYSIVDIPSGFFTLSVLPELVGEAGTYGDGHVGEYESITDGAGGAWDKTAIDRFEMLGIDLDGFYNPTNATTKTYSLTYMGATKGYNHTAVIIPFMDDGNDAFMDITESGATAFAYFNTNNIPLGIGLIGREATNSNFLVKADLDLMEAQGNYEFNLHGTASMSDAKVIPVKTLSTTTWTQGTTLTQSPTAETWTLHQFIDDGDGTGSMFVLPDTDVAVVDETLTSTESDTAVVEGVLRVPTQAEYEAVIQLDIDQIEAVATYSSWKPQYYVYPLGAYKNGSLAACQNLQQALIAKGVLMARGPKPTLLGSPVAIYPFDSLTATVEDAGMDMLAVTGVSMEDSDLFTLDENYNVQHVGGTLGTVGGVSWSYFHVVTNTARPGGTLMNLAELKVAVDTWDAARTAGTHKLMKPSEYYAELSDWSSTMPIQYSRFDHDPES